MEKISKNCYKGELLTNPLDINRLAIERKSIYMRNWGIKSASFYLGLPLRVVITLIETKSIFYVHNTKTKNHEQSTNEN